MDYYPFPNIVATKLLFCSAKIVYWNTQTDGRTSMFWSQNLNFISLPLTFGALTSIIYVQGGTKAKQSKDCLSCKNSTCNFLTRKKGGELLQFLQGHSRRFDIHVGAQVDIYVGSDLQKDPKI
jgi:hypothetical protein